jgi:transcriptional regulator with XRE-family HTH domain
MAKNEKDMERIERVQRYLKAELRKWKQQGEEEKTITDFAREAGLGRSTLSATMNGTNEISYDVCMAVSKILGPEIFGIAGYPFPVPNDPVALALVRNWHKLTNEQKEQLHKFVMNLQGGVEGDDSDQPFLLAPEVV